MQIHNGSSCLSAEVTDNKPINQSVSLLKMHVNIGQSLIRNVELGQI